MTRSRFISLILLLLLLGGMATAAPLRVVSYNVENLFYPSESQHHVDSTYTPDGERHWSWSRYRTKLAHVASVLASLSQDDWRMPAIVGLQEVEEDSCLIDLTTYYLRRHQYHWLLLPGPDTRGIHVGLLYDTTQVQLDTARALPVPLLADQRPTRDILYARFRLAASGVDPSLADSLRAPHLLHVFACHLPSMQGGARVSQPRREAAWQVLRQQTDSLLRGDRDAAIVVLGDMNSAPADQLSPLRNLMLGMPGGTEKYHGEWNMLDQFYVSPSLVPQAKAAVWSPAFLLEDDPKYLGQRPRRTYNGFRYQRDGYSDHLPVYLDLID